MFLHFLAHGKICLKLPQMGPGAVFFLLIQTLPTFWATRILILGICMFLIFWIPDFWISGFLDAQIQGCHLVIFGWGGRIIRMIWWKLTGPSSVKAGFFPWPTVSQPHVTCVPRTRTKDQEPRTKRHRDPGQPQTRNYFRAPLLCWISSNSLELLPFPVCIILPMLPKSLQKQVVAPKVNQKWLRKIPRTTKGTLKKWIQEK